MTLSTLAKVQFPVLVYQLGSCQETMLQARIRDRLLDCRDGMRRKIDLEFCTAADGDLQPLSSGPRRVEMCITETNLG